jgi:16S rRNA (guanine966-N2)-methyltransferase
MRVVAGEFRGRRLVAPPGTETRPTTDKVREAVFNALVSVDVLDGALVADLYAGTGALGIEALSRGAEQATFVETHRAARRALSQNIDALDLHDRVRVLETDALSVAGWIDVDVVFADPPYGFDRWDDLLAALRSGPRGGPALVVAEASRPVAAVDGWAVTRSKRYGRTWVAFLQPVDN